MSDKLYDINVKVFVSIPIIGDKSISLISPPENFEYKTIKFDDYEYKNKMIDGNGDVLLDFYGAIHYQGSEKYILVLCSQKEITCRWDYPANSIGAMNGKLVPLFDSIKDNYEKQLLKYFSLIHLYKEGDISYKYSFYRFITEEGICINKFNPQIVHADMLTLNLNPVIISEEEVNDVNKCISCDDKVYNILKNNCLSDLAYTYHIIDSTTNYKNLVSVLEILFIKKKEKKLKKINLSKRIAVFLESDDKAIAETYKQVRSVYDIRSNAVHYGIETTKESLNELRTIVRRCIKKYISFTEKELAQHPNMNYGELRGKLISKLSQLIKNKQFK